jgi:hypothetical protein
MLGRTRGELTPTRIVAEAFSLSARFALSFAFIIAAGTAIAVAFQPESEATALAEGPIDFDIPAQPLAAALEAFSAVSGYQILMANAGSGAGYSGAVRGTFSPKDALVQVISGTGLVARFTAAKAAILIRRDFSRDGSAPTLPGGNQAEFEARLQNDVTRTLCQNEATRPGAYRAALDLWVNPFGDVDHAELLSSTGNTGRDKEIVAMLDSLHSMSPPSGLGQPTTLLIVPRVSKSVTACDMPATQSARTR